jgi:hypothetical protein
MRLDESEQHDRADVRINVTQIDGSVATTKVGPSPRIVQKLVNAILPDTPVSISTVRRVLSTERQRQPELFALARDKPTMIAIGSGVVIPKIKADEQSGLSASEHIARQRAMRASIEQKLAQIRGEFEMVLKTLSLGQPVIDVITGEVKFVR